MPHFSTDNSAGQERQLRYLSQSIRLKESSGPGIVRSTMIILSFSVFAFMAWAGFANVHEIARTPGEIIPSGYQQVVQHMEGGIVKDILVHDGDVVKKGALLLRLDGSDAKEDLNRALGKKAVLSLQEERLRAYIDGRKPNFAGKDATHPELIADSTAFFTSMAASSARESDIIHDQIRQKKQSIGMLAGNLKTAQSNYAIITELYGRRAELNRQGIYSDVKLLETQQRKNELEGEINSLKSQISMAQSAMTEYQNRQKSLSATQKDDAHGKLDAIIAEQVQNDDMIKKLQNRVARLAITSPVDGIVKGMAINTVGSVAQPSQVLMEIVPTGENLVVSLRIPPKYVGHLKAGQNVQVKLSSYDFARYGAVAGTLQSISATTFNGENGERYYQGKVTLSKDHVGENTENKVLPGMTVMADIITGDKTILQYLLKPIRSAMSTAFTER